MINKLFIFGSGGAAKEVFNLIKDINTYSSEWNVKGFIAPGGSKKKLKNLNIVNNNSIPRANDHYGICAVSDPRLKAKIIKNEILKNGYKLASIIHPSSLIADDINIKQGSIIFPKVKISSDVKLGISLWVDFNVLIGHDVTVGKYSSIMPLSIVLGSIGDNCFIGAGSSIHQRVKIGNNVFIGIGSTIINDIKNNKKVVSFPRNVISKNEQ